MKSIGIITISFGRPQVLQLWCAQIKRLREELDMFIPAVVVSEPSDINICNKYFVHHVSHVNRPVSEKFNRAFQYMRAIEMDYVMILGSDDIISTDLFRATVVEAEKGVDVIGVNTLYFFSGQGISRGTLVRLERPPTAPLLGVAKTVSKRVLDKCDWRLWNVEKNWGMDAIASKVIKEHAETKATVKGMVVDVKTRVNLNSFRVFERYPKVDKQEFLNILSEEEKLILNSL